MHSNEKTRPVIALVATMIDLFESEPPSIETARQYAAAKKWIFFKTSAKTNKGVVELFSGLPSFSMYSPEDKRIKYKKFNARSIALPIPKGDGSARNIEDYVDTSINAGDNATCFSPNRSDKQSALGFDHFKKSVSSLKKNILSRAYSKEKNQASSEKSISDGFSTPPPIKNINVKLVSHYSTTFPGQNDIDPVNTRPGLLSRITKLLCGYSAD